MPLENAGRGLGEEMTALRPNPLTDRSRRLERGLGELLAAFCNR